MPKHGTPSYTEGQLAKFLGATTTALVLIADKLGPDVMLKWAKQGEMMQRVFMKVLSPQGVASDFIRDMSVEANWTLVEDVDEKPDPATSLELVSFLKRGEKYISGKEMRKRAEAKGANSGQRQAEYLLEHQEEIPSQWRNYYLVFSGTVWRTPGGDLRVPCLFWRSDGWRLHFHWLEVDWRSSDRLLRFSK